MQTFTDWFCAVGGAMPVQRVTAKNDHSKTNPAMWMCKLKVQLSGMSVGYHINIYLL